MKRFLLRFEKLNTRTCIRLRNKGKINKDLAMFAHKNWQNPNLFEKTSKPK